MSIWLDVRRRSATAAPVVPVRSFNGDGTFHLLRAFGGDLEEYCREAGIDSARLLEPSYRVETPQLLKLFATAETRTGDPLIGLHAAQRIRFGSLPAHLVASQNTVGDAVAAHRLVMPLALGASAVAVVHRAAVTYVTLETGLEPELARHLTEYCIASSCRLLGWLTLQAARPSEVHFRHHRTGELAEYESFFGCHVEFYADEDGAALSRATLAEPLVSANEDLATQLEDLVRTEVEQQLPLTFRERVSIALRAGRLQSRVCRREVIARRLGVSSRTLQRRLEDEGTSFGDLIDRARRQLAFELIADPAISIGDVACSVGYADQYAFNRAFRRWTGRSPSAYRREAPAANAEFA